MKVRISNETSLVVNPLTGTALIVKEEWWNKLPMSWIEKPLDSANLPTCKCEYKPLKGIQGSHPSMSAQWNVCTESEWNFLNESSFFLTQKVYQEKLDAITEFAEVFRKKRQTTFFITPDTQAKGCPLACVYCFQKEAEHASRPLLENGSVEAIEKFVQWYQTENQLPSHGICVQLFGGEPFQGKFRALWYEILEMVKRNGWCWAAVTSGATIVQEDIVMIKKYQNNNLQELNITLDGLEEEHNSFRPFKGGNGTWSTVVSNIGLLLDAGIPVLVKTNFGVKNIATYPRFLDLIKKTNWRSGDLVIMTNLIQSFGEVETGGTKGTEDALILALCDILSHPDYQCFLPIIRLEGKKLTGYLANILAPKVIQDARVKRNGKVVFDDYPYQGFCNPAKGTSWNIDPEGFMRTCNWMDGQKEFVEMSVFNTQTWVSESRYFNPISKHSICSKCDISTLCGGGCAIDIQKKEKGEYYLSCREKHYEIITGFVLGCVQRGWLNPNLPSSDNYRLISPGFNFDYKYYNRAITSDRISHAGAAM